MTKSMFTSAVIWLTPPLLVAFFTMTRFWVTFDPICFQDLILSSSFITQTLTACSPFGQPSTLVSGLHVVQLKAEPGPSLETLPSTVILVGYITFEPSVLLLTTYYIPGLTPFWNTQTGFWSSSETTKTAGLHYTYPEFNNLNLGDPGAVQRAIAGYVNQHYGRSPRSTSPALSLSAQQPVEGDAPALAALSVVKSAAEEIQHPIVGGHSNPVGREREGPNVVPDWTARIHFKKFELGESFAVLLFLGEVPDDASQWRTCPSFVGSHVAFVNSAADQCGNCREQADVVSEGFVHLNSAIADRSGLSSYEPNVVIPYLRDNLCWRIQGVRSFS